MKKMKPQIDKTDPSRIKIEKVQYWRNGIMLTAQMSREIAQELVRKGEAYVISDQAIGAR